MAESMTTKDEESVVTLIVADIHGIRISNKVKLLVHLLAYLIVFIVLF